MNVEHDTPPNDTEQEPRARGRLRRPRFLFRKRTVAGEDSGQAIVEFAIVSVAFFMMVFGTIDFGRAIYMYSQLHNAVREGARYGKMMPADETGIKDRVVSYSSALNIAPEDITVDCNGPCYPGCASVEVTATGHFQAITQELLGISPLDLTAKAHVITE